MKMFELPKPQPPCGPPPYGPAPGVQRKYSDPPITDPRPYQPPPPYVLQKPTVKF